MYKVTSTESHNEKANDFETKSLFYLMNYFSKSNSVHWAVIDFFNDVTGVDRLCEECFDVQSKNIDNITPSKLGEFTVTLFKNYLSDLNFTSFILFVRGVSKKLQTIIGNKKTFSFNDLTSDSKSSVINGLINEANTKTYIEDKTKINPTNVSAFLEKVTFVIDDKDKEKYILDAVSISSSLSFDSVHLSKLFKEIRDMQSAKKNNNVDGEIINSIGDFISFDKHFKIQDLQLLLINRLCFKDVFLRRGLHIPPLFIDVYNRLDLLSREELTESCQSAIIRLLYDNNNRKNYWVLFNEVVSAIKSINGNVDEIYDAINKDAIRLVTHLDELSSKYFIALVQERIKNDNN